MSPSNFHLYDLLFSLVSSLVSTKKPTAFDVYLSLVYERHPQLSFGLAVVTFEDSTLISEASTSTDGVVENLRSAGWV